MAYLDEVNDCERICGGLIWASNHIGRATKEDYVRHAVDNLRKVSLLTEENRTSGDDGTRESGIGVLSYELACYVDAIEYVCDHVDGTIEKEEQVLEIVKTTVEKINKDKILERTDTAKDNRDVDKAMFSFARELRDRLNSPSSYHPIETLALIEFRLTHIGLFYKGFNSYPDRRIVEAIGAWYLMRGSMKLPDYKESIYEQNSKPVLARKSGLKLAIHKVSISIESLRRRGSFVARVEALWQGFRRPEIPVSDQTEIPLDPWRIADNYTRGHNSTIYNPLFVTNTPDDIDQLRRSTGLPPEELVVFRPERMAIQETIAAAVTRIKMDDPQQFIENRLFGPRQIYRNFVAPILKASGLELEFDTFLKKMRDYVDYVMDDHFVIVSPNIEIRELLANHKKTIELRITDNKYEPKLVETRNILRNLVTNDITRGYFQQRVRKIVDKAISLYLEKKPRLKLKLHSNQERLSFVTIGGPASGKSTMKDLIQIEYAELTGSRDSLCQIDSDHYKPILSRGAKGRIAGQSWSESDLVRRLAEDRLAHMINFDGKAPDFWISATSPRPERMQLLSSETSKVIVYVVTCPVEGDDGAAKRSYERACKPGPDFGRFLPTKELLEKHKDASKLLPEFLANRRIVRLYSTQSPIGKGGRILRLFAKMDGHNRGLRVLDPASFISFVKKALINKKADSETTVFDTHSIYDKIANEIWLYMKNGLTITFRYTDRIAPNPLHKKYTEPTRLGMVENDLQLHAVLLSQPEAYLWAGHDRVEVTDLETCIRVLGNEMLISFIKRFSKEWPLKIRDYSGNLLLNVDMSIGMCKITPDKIEPSMRVFVETVKIKLMHAESQTPDF